MCTESDQSTINRVSCFLNMNDSQNQNNFDFVPKSDYNEKLHLENKCLFHNQQFLEGEKCGIRKRCTINSLTCDHCSSFGEKLKSKTDGNLDEKSGDWKYDEKFIKDSIENIQEPTEWKWKNPYSISDFDRSKYCRHNFTENDFTTNLLRDLCDKDSRFKIPSKIDNNKNILYNFREYLVNYQASCGIPRTEYSFLALISMMGRATGRSLLALLYVMLNIIPVMEVLSNN
ncbi:hypothetical protein APICC_03449 [Apis cerana cerana]|uniref:Uncharacterized protein n=1 Tax=Apis cerana cerana TaxID=94128 RepID=A0A2A3ECV3_APICC|nr:hypothetical protein APICC_03449 [Apis cerana cerana]